MEARLLLLGLMLLYMGTVLSSHGLVTGHLLFPRLSNCHLFDCFYGMSWLPLADTMICYWCWHTVTIWA